MSLDEALIQALEAAAPARRDEPLSRHTTIGIGGPADVFVTARDAAQLSQVLGLAHSARAPVFVLGSGSNIVVGDGGIRGVVIENKAAAVTGPSTLDEGRQGFRIESGASFALVARQLAFGGYAGLEWACGIPGTLGGAVVYNAGAYGGCLGDVLQRIAVWDETEGEVVYEAADLGLVYRGSAFTRGLMAGRAVLWADVALWPGDTEALKARVADYDARRLKAQPRGRNAGSFFKNPPEHPAWRLIDGVGLRGHRIGGAEFSERHCNFLINAGGATAADVEALKNLAQSRVQKQYGIELENEVTLVGEGWSAV
jgi:UDP-N-acetylmuramate dehydrogenase